MITLRPDGPLRDQLDRSRLAVEVAQEHFHHTLMHDVARIVRDALPTATWLLIDTNGLDVPPVGVVLHAILGPGSPDRNLWDRNDERPEDPVIAYRTSNGVTWPDVVRHLEQELTTAMGTDKPGMWWEPRDDRGDDGFYYAKLPDVEDVAAIQTDQPRHLAAYLTDRDAPPFSGLWHAKPVPCPTMSAAGVAITASVADDGVFIVDIDRTGNAVTVMPPIGQGTPVRVRLDSATMAPPTEPNGVGGNAGS